MVDRDIRGSLFPCSLLDEKGDSKRRALKSSESGVLWNHRMLFSDNGIHG